MQTRPQIRNVQDLLGRIDACVDAASDAERCEGVKQALEAATAAGVELLDDSMLEPVPGGYARRLLHRDPAGRYTIVIMVWGAGQGTPLHDHSGMWCVECVYRGKIKVVSFSRAANRCSGQGIYDFTEEQTMIAGVGEAGALIPPFEYHTIENHSGPTAVTIHVYGGEMSRCNLFEPAAGGGYQTMSRDLSYTV